MKKKKSIWDKLSKNLKKNEKEVLDPLLAAIASMTTAFQASAFNLQSKPQNTDKTLFNVISGAQTIKKSHWRVFGETNYQMSPLIQKDSKLGEQTLVDGLLGVELSVLYGITDKLQIGIMVPGQTPFGVMGGYDQFKSSLGDILIEPKIYLMDGVALIPLYYAPTGDPEAGAGSNSGAYGAKVAAEFGDINKKGVVAVQVGAIMAPDTMYQELDQSMRYHFGVGGGMKISEGLRWMAEVYGEKTKSNFPLEALTFLEFQKKDWSVRVGGGSGDLNGGGSNTARAFVGFSWDLGKIESKSSPKKESPEGFYVPTINTPKVNKEEKKVEGDNKNIQERDGFQESQGPDVLTPETPENKDKEDSPEIDLNIDFLENSSYNYHKSGDFVSIIPQKIIDEIKGCYPYAQDKEIRKNLTLFSNMLRDRLDCTDGKSLDEVLYNTAKISFLMYNREPASITYKDDTSLKVENDPLYAEVKKTLKDSQSFLNKVKGRISQADENLDMTKNYPKWTKNKADLTYSKLKEAHEVLSYNLDLYQKAMASENKEEIKQQIVELTWGLRVINKRVDYIKFLDEKHKEYTSKSFLDISHVLPPRTEKEIQDYNLAKKIVHSYYGDEKYLKSLDKVRITKVVVEKKKDQVEEIKRNIKQEEKIILEKRAENAKETKEIKKNLNEEKIKSNLVEKKVLDKSLKVLKLEKKQATKMKKLLDQSAKELEIIGENKTILDSKVDKVWSKLAEIETEYRLLQIEKRAKAEADKKAAEQFARELEKEKDQIRKEQEDKVKKADLAIEKIIKEEALRVEKEKLAEKKKEEQRAEKVKIADENIEKIISQEKENQDKIKEKNTIEQNNKVKKADAAIKEIIDQEKTLKEQRVKQADISIDSLIKEEKERQLKLVQDQKAKEKEELARKEKEEIQALALKEKKEKEAQALKEQENLALKKKEAQALKEKEEKEEQALKEKQRKELVEKVKQGAKNNLNILNSQLKQEEETLDLLGKSKNVLDTIKKEDSLREKERLVKEVEIVENKKEDSAVSNLEDLKEDGYEKVVIDKVEPVKDRNQAAEKSEEKLKVKYFDGEITELPDVGEVFISNKKEEDKKEEKVEKEIEQQAQEKTQDLPEQLDKEIEYYNEEEDIVEVVPKSEKPIEVKEIKEEVVEQKKEVEKETPKQEEKVVEEIVEEKKIEKEEPIEILSVEEVERKIEEKMDKEKTEDLDAEKMQEKKKNLVEKEIELLKMEVKKIEQEKRLEEIQKEEDKKAQEIKEEKQEEPTEVEETEVQQVEIKKVEKVQPEESKRILIKENEPISIQLPQPKMEERPEPVIPKANEKFNGLEDEDPMEYIDGPSFNDLDE